MYNVLIVENNPTIMRLLSHFFRAEGCAIRLANDGQQALQVLESFTPDILCTDIIMPKISGDLLCRIVRQDPKTRDIFIVIYSAMAVEDEQHIFELEADLYIAKGPNDIIKNHIRRILDQFRDGKRREDILYGTNGLHARTITSELLLARRHHSAVMDNLAEAVVEMDSRGQIVQANRAAQELLACDLATLLSGRLLDHLSGPEYPLVEQWFAQHSAEASTQLHSRCDRPMMVGKYLVALHLVRIAEKDDFFFIAILQDITPYKRIEETLVKTVDEFNAVMESIEYGILFMDTHLRARIANRAFREMWGITDDFFATHPNLRDLINFNRYKGIYAVSEESFDSYLEKREAAIRRGDSGPEEFYRRDGKVYQYQCVNLPDGGRMLTYFDITKHKNTLGQLANALEEVHAQANRDPLTGLPNLRLLQERFFSTVCMAKRKGWRAAIMFIDLDGFKAVNDVYGHKVGDIILKMVAQRLLKLMREADTVARIGGDEFLIIQTEVNNDAAVSGVAKKVLQQLSEPFEVAGTAIRIGASIGIAMYPVHGDDVQILIKKADNAMYAAKSSGKQRHAFAPEE